MGISKSTASSSRAPLSDSRGGQSNIRSRSTVNATAHPRISRKPQCQTRIPSSKTSSSSGVAEFSNQPQRKTSERSKPKRLASFVAVLLLPNREDQTNGAAITTPNSSGFPDLGGFRELRLLAEAFWDAQKHRCAQENRFRYAPVNKDLTRLLLEPAERVEAEAGKAMLSCFRRIAPEVAEWAESRRGVGEHTVARLLGVIGHPAIAEPYHWQEGKKPEGHVCNGHCGKTREGKQKHLVADPPYLRMVSQLWSYCGVGDPTRRRRKGMEQGHAMSAGSVRARTLVYLMAVAQEKCALTNPGAYRLLYDESKADYAKRHTDWTPKHRQNAALRLVGKEMLKDIWIVARKNLGASAAAETIFGARPKVCSSRPLLPTPCGA